MTRMMVVVAALVSVSLVGMVVMGMYSSARIDRRQQAWWRGRERERVELERLVAEASATARAVIFVKFSMAVEWLDLLVLGRAYFEDFWLADVVVWVPTDAAAARACEAFGWRCYVSDSLVDERAMAGGVEFGSKAYLDIVWLTARILADVLVFADGIDVVYLDLDQLWFSNPLEGLRAVAAARRAAGDDVDYVAVCENVESINGGIHFFPAADPRSPARRATQKLMADWHACRNLPTDRLKLDQEFLDDLLREDDRRPSLRMYVNCYNNDLKFWATCFGDMPSGAGYFGIHLTCLFSAAEKLATIEQLGASHPGLVPITLSPPACATQRAQGAMSYLRCRLTPDGRVNRNL